ncbi:hypothetical protein DL1_15995 [Thioclava dalianensis]|uniref:DUF302 domain-containing protein n=1 Tax=Thioclava dalianensis TaxID=1185766 RepID=A0A074TNL7_9RHOB|nr:DUF302 domain-containing protein [Thioclava dalianensis]KEP70608.1 hypothetical protein DL1_15995 [Thioclava dalianensis]SFN06675.1 Uncharacterized conserved protein, DUF302 family [Thioclava dalianensis]
MGFTLDTVLDADFDTVETQVRSCLNDAGFVVLTEFNVSAKIKASVHKDISRFKIFGIGNSQLSYEAICLVAKVGVLLPCNIALREVEGGVEVSAVDPVVLLGVVKNPDVDKLAQEMRRRLAAALECLSVSAKLSETTGN